MFCSKSVFPGETKERERIIAEEEEQSKRLAAAQNHDDDDDANPSQPSFLSRVASHRFVQPVLVFMLWLFSFVQPIFGGLVDWWSSHACRTIAVLSVMITLFVDVSVGFPSGIAPSSDSPLLLFIGPITLFLHDQ